MQPVSEVIGSRRKERQHEDERKDAPITFSYRLATNEDLRLTLVGVSRQR